MSLYTDPSTTRNTAVNSLQTNVPRDATCLCKISFQLLQILLFPKKYCCMITLCMRIIVMFWSVYECYCLSNVRVGIFGILSSFINHEQLCVMLGFSHSTTWTLDSLPLVKHSYYHSYYFSLISTASSMVSLLTVCNGL